MNNTFIDFLVENMPFTIRTCLIIVGIVVLTGVLIFCNIREKKKRRAKQQSEKGREKKSSPQ